MNTKIRNFITPLLLISSFYINASLNQVIDVISSLQGSGASASTTVTSQAIAKLPTNFTPPAKAIDISNKTAILPAGETITQLWFSPLFKRGNQTVFAELPVQNSSAAFQAINVVAGQGHPVAFTFSVIQTKASFVGLVKAYDLNTQKLITELAFDNIQVFVQGQTSRAQTALALTDSYFALNITSQDSSMQQATALQADAYKAFSIVPGTSAIAKNQLILRSNTINNLTVVALNGSATPSTYFDNAWTAIQKAVKKLGQNQTLNFSIVNNNVTCENIPATPLLETADVYLVVAEDSTGYIAATVTNSDFTISVNKSLPATNKSNFILPASQNPIEQFTIFTTTGNQGQYIGYAYLPNFLSAGTEWMSVFNALKSNINMTNPLEVTMSGNAVNFSYSGGTVTTLNLTNTNTKTNPSDNPPYILVIQDGNGNYHYATMDSNGKIVIQVKK